MCDIAINYPQSFSMAQKYVGLLSQSFEKFVVCPSCHAIYNFDDCVIKTYNGKLESAKCKHVQFPNHPQAQFRKECGEDLLKHVKGNRTNTAPQHLVCRAVQSLHINHMQTGIIEVFICRRGAV